MFPLVVFATPGVAVYDGERLFLTSFPLWAVFIGRGWVSFYQLLLRFLQSRIVARVAGLCLLIVTAWPLVEMSPCHLCYYNRMAKLVSDSEKGQPSWETDYWGVGITRSLLKKVVETVPEGATVGILPTLHQFQADDYQRQSPILRAHGIKTVAFDPTLKYVIVFRRLADLPESYRQGELENAIGITVRDRSLIAGLIRTDSSE